MNYLLKSSQTKRKSEVRLVLLFIVFVLFFLFITPFGKKTVRAFFSPILRSSNFIGGFFVNNFELLRSKRQLLEENQKLKVDLEEIKKDIKFLSVLEEENQELKRIKKNSDYNDYIVGSVISRPEKTPYDVLLLDVGEKSGVSEGDLVLYDGNVFIGEVYESNESFSKVRMYSSSENKTPVLIGNVKTERDAIGLGMGNFKIEVSNEIEVKIGDKIIFPSSVSNIFGEVEKIEQKPTDSFKTVLFRSPINIQNIRFVEIVNKK